MKNKKVLNKIFIIIVIIFILFFLIYYKIKNNGNNIGKTINNLEEYILNINSYEAKIEVTVDSNKTTNKYKLEQLYCKPNFMKQIIKEPKNIENLSIIYDGNSMLLENTNLSLSKIYENYKYINTNVLWLSSFIENYNKNSKISETENELIIENNNEYNKYNIKQVLYINKITKLPTEMKIYDNNKNTKIYIKYNEIKLNKLNKNEMLKQNI